MDLLAGPSLLFSAISPSHILSSFQQTINEARQWAKLLNPIFVSLHLGIVTSSSPMIKWASLKFPNRSLPREMCGKPLTYLPAAPGLGTTEQISWVSASCPAWHSSSSLPPASPQAHIPISMQSAWKPAWRAQTSSIPFVEISRCRLHTEKQFFLHTVYCYLENAFMCISSCDPEWNCHLKSKNAWTQTSKIQLSFRLSTPFLKCGWVPKRAQVKALPQCGPSFWVSVSKMGEISCHFHLFWPTSSLPWSPRLWPPHLHSGFFY